MLNTDYYILTFNSSTMAIAAKLELKDYSGFRIIPLPEQIDSSCGLCMKVEKDVFDEIYNKLENSNLRVEGVYACHMESGGLKCTILTMLPQQ